MILLRSLSLYIYIIYMSYVNMFITYNQLQCNLMPFGCQTWQWKPCKPLDMKVIGVIFSYQHFIKDEMLRSL